MEMMECPHCGIKNSPKRDYCYQCQGALRGPAKVDEERGYVPTCANCAHAAIFPPPGKQISPDQVWCMKQEEVVPCAKVGGDCFEEAFGWKREDILD